MKPSIACSFRWNANPGRSRLWLALLVTGFSVSVLADPDPANLPTGFSTPAGMDVSRTWDGNTKLVIDQGSARGIAYWDSFNIGAGNTVRVEQPNASAILLNRVIGDSRSNINGVLSADGHVYLLNPNGVTFGNGAEVSVGGILASTGKINEDAFMAGQPLTLSDIGGNIWIDSGATLTATGGRKGLIALVGGSVDNSGELSAPSGSIAMVSGEQVTFDPFGDGLTTFRVDAGMGDASVWNSGRIAADGGRVALLGDSPEVSIISSWNPDVANAVQIRARGGEIILDAGTGHVSIDGSQIDVRGDGSDDGGRIAIRGGTVTLSAVEDSNGNLIEPTVLDASATGSSAGGDIQVIANDPNADSDNPDLILDATLLATGGKAGGSIETSGQFFSLRERFALDASASAPDGEAGSWLLDPQDLTITSGPQSPTPNTVADSTINAMLDSGTSMTVATASGGSGNGDVTFDSGVHIQRSSAGAPVTFGVDAHGRILAGFDVNIESQPNAGALNVDLHAGESIDFGGSIASNGGDIALRGDGATGSVAGVAMTGGAGIEVNSTDTGSGQGDGDITVHGHAAGMGRGVDLQDGTTLISGQGTMDIVGTVETGTGRDTGVYMSTATLQSSSGPIRIFGLGREDGASGANANGVFIGQSTVSTTDGGDVSIRGLLLNGRAGGAGVMLVSDAQVAADGNLEMTGSTDGLAAGIVIDGPNGAANVTASGHATLRAGNDGSTDAIVIGDDGTVHADGMLNLRPGEVSASGGASDRTGDAIALGSNGNGFSVSADEFSRLSAGDAIVVGSAVHAGAITVDDDLSMADALTLQNEGAGSGGIALQAPVTVSSPGGLALLSGGDVTQASGASITAPQVLARSGAGDVLLTDAGNDADTVSGAADQGRFEWVDADDVQLAAMDATGAQAAVNSPQNIHAATLSARNVHVQTLSGDLTLSQPMSSSAGADLIAAGLFQNPGSGSASGAPWRVWASTWQGETRGGMSGSGPLPNLYNCPFGGPCGVSIPSGDNHFIYKAQPVVTVVMDDASRPQGWPNPPLTYSINGLILGDGAAAISGSPSTAANQLSPMGSYPINGTFTSPAGYLVNVRPGTLTVTEFVPPFGTAIPLPTLGLSGSSAIYEDNLAGAPICLATEPLDGDGGMVAGDTLAREWSRVRSRPRLNNCVNSDHSEACGDF